MKNYILLFSIFLSINLLGGTVGALNGVYTISNQSSDSANYSNINAAINDLEILGISGPVIFNISSGTYTEQITIPEITGASDTNTITFQSLSGDSSDVILQYNAIGTNDNYVINGDQIKHLRFKKISFKSLSQSYSTMIKLNSYCQDIQFTNCNFNSASTITNNSINGAITNFSGYDVNDIHFENNHFEGGNYGIFMNGSTSAKSKRLVVKKNLFQNTSYYGIYVQRVDSVLFEQNTIISKDSCWAHLAIYYTYSDGYSRISKNTIINRASANFYGIMIVNKTSDYSVPLEISNNFISSTRTVQYATGGIMITSSSYINAFYNTIRINGSSSNDSYVVKINTSSGIQLKNNILLNEDQGFTYYIDSLSAISSSTNNCFYKNGGDFAYVQDYYSTITNIQDSTGLESNSIQLNPNFSDAYDYHPKNILLNGSALPLTTITSDIDGETRDTLNPDIGCNEFLPNFMHGLYTIGSSGADYTGFTTAVSDLNNRGIDSAVVFKVSSGEYTEQIIINEVTGASASNTITFQSASGNNSDVILKNDAIDSTHNWTIKLNSADYLSFKNMTIKAIDSTFANVVELTGGADHNSFINNKIESIVSANTTGSVIFDDVTLNHYNSYKNNEIIGGYYGIHSFGDYYSSLYEKGTIIDSNEIYGFSRTGIDLFCQDSIQIKYNYIHSNTINSQIYGIQLNRGMNAYRVIGNKIELTNVTNKGCLGIDDFSGNHYYDNPSPTGYGLVANNFISLKGGQYQAHMGLSANYCNGTEYLFNSIYISGGSVYSRCLDCNTDAVNTLGQTYKNNIFANFGPGYSAIFQNSSFIGSSDYNNFYSSGSNFVMWNNTSKSDIASYKSASGIDTNSVSFNPYFISSTDLHVNSAAMNDKGIPVSGVTTDIDGEIRSTTNPDIGADEYTPAANDAGVLSITSSNACEGPQYMTAEIKNFGTSALTSATINWKINGVSQTPYSWTGNLSTSDTAFVVIAQNIITSASQSYEFLCFTTNPNGQPDGVAQNDTFLISNQTYHPLASISISNINNSYCQSDNSVLLTASPLGGVFTINGSQSSMLDPSTTTGNVEIVYTFTDAMACIATDTIYTYIYSNPIIIIDTSLSNHFCSNENSINLTATPTGGIFAGSGVSGSSFDPSTANLGTNQITYSYTDGNGCYDSDSIQVQINAAPTVSITSSLSTAYCSDAATVNLAATPTGGIFAGSGVSGSSFDPNTANLGTNQITYSYTDGNGCYDSDSIQVQINAAPNVSITSSLSTAYCSDAATVNLAATPTGGIFAGSGVSGSSFDPNTANLGTNQITYSYTDGNGCYDSDSIQVQINAAPNVSITSSLSTAYCSDAATVNLAATPTGGIFAGSGVSGSSFDPNTANLGTNQITYSYTDGNGCYDSDSIQVQINAAPNVSITSSLSTAYCSDAATVNLAATPTGGIFAGSGVSGSSFDPNTANLGTNQITYSYTDGNGCYDSDSIQVQINAAPNVSITSSLSTAYCSNAATVNLSATPTGGVFAGPGVSGQVFNPSTANIGSNQLVYSFTDANSCSNSDTISVTVNSIPAVSLGSQADVCENISSVNLSNAIPTGGSYSGTGIIGSGVFYPTIAGAGTHSLTYIYTDANGCTDTANSSIKVKTVPTSNFTLPASTCLNDSILVNYTGSAGGSAAFNWNFDNATILSGTDEGPYNVSWNQAGLKQLSLIVTDSGCTSATYNIYVNVKSSFAYITAVGNTTACYGDSVTLFANSGLNYSYQWYDTLGVMIGDTLSYINIGQSGDYYCVVTAPNACASPSNTISVTIKDEIIADFTIANEVCVNDTVSISFIGTAPIGSVFNWDFDNANIVSGSGSGPYNIYWTNDNLRTVSLEITEGNCSSDIYSHNIQIQSVTASITALGNTSFCMGDSVSLLANTANNLSYVWKKDQQIIAGANLSFYTANQSGDYSVLVTDLSTSCKNESSQLSVIANTTNFNIDFTASPTSFNIPPFNTIFNNNTLNPNNYYWTWYFGDGNTSGLISPAHQYNFDGGYDVSLIAENVQTGCLDTLIKPNYISCSGGNINPCSLTPDIIINGNSIICPNDSVMLKSNQISPYISYKWIKDGVLIGGANDSIYYAKQNGMYQLMLTDTVCTQFSNAVNISNYPTINPVISSNGSIMPCTNDSIELYVNTYFNSYLWSTGDSSSSIFVKNSGDYSVSVNDVNGCQTTSAPFTVNASLLSTPEICIVGVDSNNNNRIIWERNNDPLIDSFRVYRESTIAGQYVLIGSKAANEVSIISDTASDPQIRAYRYKITAVDTCGMETPPSPHHKSIHLTINAGLNGTWNLIWDHYHGFNYNTYKIYRGTSPSNISLLTQLPSTSASYTDLNPPSGTVYYQIEVVKSSGCYPDSTFTKANTNYNSSRSNVANNGSIVPIYLVADFNADVVTGQWPIQVSFNDLSSGNPTSWMWNFGDGNTSVEQNPQHTYNNTGLYDIQLIACNSGICDTTIKQDYINVLPNGMVEIDVELSAKIYPNPNDGSFTLEINSKKAKDATVYIYNNIGQLVYSEEFNINSHTYKKLDLSSQAKGIYHVHLSTDKGVVYREKVVVQ